MAKKEVSKPKPGTKSSLPVSRSKKKPSTRSTPKLHSSRILRSTQVTSAASGKKAKLITPVTSSSSVTNSKQSAPVTTAVSGTNSKQSTPGTSLLNEINSQKSASLNGLVKNDKRTVNLDYLRRATVFIIVSSLIFAIGVQVGRQNGKALVDDAIDTVLNNGAKELDKGVLERAAIEGVLKATGDEWANYFPKSALEVFEEQSTNVFNGIGVSLTKSRAGLIKISSVQAGSPAQESGLQVGDQLLEVNGTDVRGASLTSIIALIRGDVGKKIELLVTRDDKRILAALATEKLAVRTVDANQVSDKVALLEIASFSQGTAQDVKEALSNLNYKSGVILDLRNNPGGSIEEAVRVAEIFIGKGVIVSYQVNGAEKLFRAANSEPVTAPVIVMINRNTASAAEILAGAFQDRNRGVVIGERSYGKGSVQEFVTLGDGSKLELTVALYRTPSGRIIDEVGITPDLEVSNSEIGVRALQVLGGLASLITPK